MSETSSRIEPIVKILVDVEDLLSLFACAADCQQCKPGAAQAIREKYKPMIERARSAR